MSAIKKNATNECFDQIDESLKINSSFKTELFITYSLYVAQKLHIERVNLHLFCYLLSVPLYKTNYDLKMGTYSHY